MTKIQLPGGVWEYDPAAQLGRSGGFGAVFRGYSESGHFVAIKRLHVSATEAAHRELAIASELKGKVLNNIVPIFDSGQDAASEGYFVVMALADGNLDDHCLARGPLPWSEVVAILKGLTDGLIEIGDIVHRDLKPANILLHEGRWKIADFGIARFVEESTSANTLKDCLSPQYAAPEQWNLERATRATDIYSSGCIGYRMLAGRVPFQGPDFRQQHLESQPPPLESDSPRLISLIQQMMRKPPLARPTAKRILEILASTAREGDVAALGALAAADARVGHALATQEAAERAKKNELAKRKELAISAQTALHEIGERLIAQILDSASNATRKSRKGEKIIAVGGGFALLEISIPGVFFEPDQFPQSRWNVITAGEISLTQFARISPPQYYLQRLYRRSASLWFTNLGVMGQDYRWYEASYTMPLTPSSAGTPCAIGLENLRLADEAASPIMGTAQLARAPTPIDDEDFDGFAERWIGLFAQAMEGRLTE